MAVLLSVERKTAKAKIFLALVYALLSLGGVTMVWPFLVMIASSLCGPYDYYRFSPLVRAMWDRDDRFMRYVASCFPYFPREIYPEAPAHWGSWVTVSRDGAASRAFAAAQLKELDDADNAVRWQRRAADYAHFNSTYDLRNSVCHFDGRDVVGFVRRQYEAKARAADPQGYATLNTAERRVAALAALNAEWPVRYTSFFGIRMIAQQRVPLHHSGWDYPEDDAKMDTYQAFKAMYRTQAEAAEAPMSRTLPFTSQPLWQTYLNRALPEAAAMWGGVFPLPEQAPQKVQAIWARFVQTSYPRRLLRIRVTPARERAYQRYVRESCRTAKNYLTLTGHALPQPRAPDPETGAFSGLTLPAYENSTLWRNFIPQVPLEELTLLSAEQAWQTFLLERYGTLAGVNRAYGWSLDQIEAARLPLREALTVTFAKRGWRDFFGSMLNNYRLVGEFLFVRGRAFGNTLLLVLLSVLATLTVNPLAAYALSRFGMNVAEKILLFLLATMAFPAAVTAIPGFLLIRDLGLLNTFAALVLPTLASGMSIFILKGFFDGLPRELYEAAAMDGAKEWQILFHITLPMTTPILAVNALAAFVYAYNSWEWALLVCQEQRYWTLAVWMYQMSQQLQEQPWAVMAGFVLVSIPTAVVFIACQKVILRGIVLPSMK